MMWLFGALRQPPEGSSVPAQSDYDYSAIYESAQGSFPLTIWEREAGVGQKVLKDRDPFRLSVVNTPTIIQSCPADSARSSSARPSRGCIPQLYSPLARLSVPHHENGNPNLASFQHKRWIASSCRSMTHFICGRRHHQCRW
jgi:hypothetical protein